ncbi:MAG: hypothetical protein ACXVIV_03405 [Halobacteriota archaeon]
MPLRADDDPVNSGTERFGRTAVGGLFRTPTYSSEKEDAEMVDTGDIKEKSKELVGEVKKKKSEAEGEAIKQKKIAEGEREKRRREDEVDL